MLKAWQAKIAPEADLALPSQTFIVGTAAARKAFNPSYEGILAPVDAALTCDIQTLQALHSRPNWHWVVIVQSAAELCVISTHIQSPDPSRVVVAVVCEDEKEHCAIRDAALNHLGGVGVVIPGGKTSGRATQLVQRLLHAWAQAQNSLDSANKYQATLSRIWGEPSLSSTAEVIIPPSWDSEGKIRAVIDAAGWDYDEIMRESSWNSPAIPGEDSVLPTMTEAQAKVKFGEAAAKMKEDMAKEEAWLKSLEERIARHEQTQKAAIEQSGNPPGGNASTKTKADAPPETEESAPAKADFFQRLLGLQ